MFPRLRALLQLPSQISALLPPLAEHSALMRESNALQRELIQSLTSAPSSVPETPDLSTFSGPLEAQPPRPKDPRRIRTDKDVTYSSRSFLAGQDERAAAEQAPWRQSNR